MTRSCITVGPQVFAVHDDARAMTMLTKAIAERASRISRALAMTRRLPEREAAERRLPACISPFYPGAPMGGQRPKPADLGWGGTILGIFNVMPATPSPAVPGA
jgi:hypothetical protein